MAGHIVTAVHDSYVDKLTLEIHGYDCSLVKMGKILNVPLMC